MLEPRSVSLLSRRTLLAGAAARGATGGLTLRVKQKGVTGYANRYRPFFWNVGLAR